MKNLVLASYAVDPSLSVEIAWMTSGYSSTMLIGEVEERTQLSLDMINASAAYDVHMFEIPQKTKMDLIQ